MPFNANLVLRQVGLVFFLAAIGTKAGDGFGATFQSGGWGLIVAGAIITTLVTITTILIGHIYLKLPMAAVMGLMSGIQTQPACLAYANQQTDTDLPNVWYTTVYPASMVAKIILAQMIVSILMISEVLSARTRKLELQDLAEHGNLARFRDSLRNHESSNICRWCARAYWQYSSRSIPADLPESQCRDLGEA